DKSIEAESKQFDKDGNIFYIPQYDENIESIALKFNISSSDLIIWNSLQERTVKSGTNLIVGKKGEYEVVDSDNPSSDDLMALNIENTDQLLIREDVGQSSLEKRLNEEFDNSYELEETLKNFYAYKEKNDTNFIYGLLNYNIAHYSVIALQKIGVKRLESSDIVQLSYKTNDPGICQYTLVLLSNVFIKNYKIIKENQSDKVVKYFQEEVNNANERLQSAEDELLRFNKDNNIINYYEQTKYIAAEKENLDRDYQDEKMNLAASKAAYEKLESKLATQPGIKFNREDILNKTKEISILTEKITFLETEPEPNESTQNEIRRLNQLLTKLKSEIRRIVDYEFTSSSSIEGIPVQEVLTQWLEAIIAYEESEARLNVYSERKAGVERTYTTFAPLGAKLKRIEREIEVSEKEYLSLLNSLNSSKLKQQNIELSSNIKPVGFPFYPITPKTQLKKFLMPGAAILGFILCFLILILLELLDRNINNPKTALTHTSMQTVSAFPFIPRKFRKIDFPFIIKKLSEQIIQHIKLLSSKIIGRPIIVGITSTRNNEGKTRIVTELVQQIRESGDKVLFINHSNDLDGKIDEDTYCYKLNHKYSDVKDYKELCPEINSFSNYRYIFIELPSLIYNVYPFELVSKLDTTYIVCQAKRVWSSADQKVYQNLKGSLNHEAFLILNNA
ncbi:MAG: hypothetical protein HOM80_01165, partial [Bacteroidetes bacterium]|nr:hypothetical protein [Bacteroidota bacterium]